jgi:hypothetical protein
VKWRTITAGRSDAEGAVSSVLAFFGEGSGCVERRGPREGRWDWSAKVLVDDDEMDEDEE